jgi:hypothetical protein
LVTPKQKDFIKRFRAGEAVGLGCAWGMGGNGEWRKRKKEESKDKRNRSLVSIHRDLLVETCGLA